MYIFGFEYFKEQTVICPVCGESVMGMLGDICDVCGWENDDLPENDDDYETANYISLNMYKQKFFEMRKKNPDYTYDKDGIFEITDEDFKECERIFKEKYPNF